MVLLINRLPCVAAILCQFSCSFVNCNSVICCNASAMLICVAHAKSILPNPSFLSCPFPKAMHDAPARMFICVLRCYVCVVVIVQCYLVNICMSVLVLLRMYTLWLCENVIVVRIRLKVGNRARCGGWVVCIARKILYIHLCFCKHVYWMHGR